MKMQLHQKFSGQYKVEVRGADGQIKFESGYFFNLITDAFFEGWLGNPGGLNRSRGGMFSYCAVGTGVATPAFGDTTITQLGVRAAVFSDSPSRVSRAFTNTIQYRWNPSDIIGTISEVGIYSAGTGGTLSSRSLIKDVGGTPTSITLVSGDVLYVTWRITNTLPAGDVLGVVNIAGIDYNYVIRPANIGTLADSFAGIVSPFMPSCPQSAPTNPNGQGAGYIVACAASTQSLAADTSNLTGINGNSGAHSGAYAMSTYVSSSKQIKSTFDFSIGTGNTAGGIGSIFLGNVHIFGVCDTSTGGYQMTFAAVSGGAPIPKDNTKVFRIAFIYSFGR